MLLIRLRKRFWKEQKTRFLIIYYYFQFLENRLIGNFDSEDFSDAWKKKFAHAPTWCDADMSLQQINRVSYLLVFFVEKSRFSGQGNRKPNRSLCQSILPVMALQNWLFCTAIRVVAYSDKVKIKTNCKI